jgi:pimeloyl-ACP methyl ester carboxylesterase
MHMQIVCERCARTGRIALRTLMCVAMAGMLHAADLRGAGAAEVATDPLRPVAMPAQPSTKEGIAQIADTRLWFTDTGGTGEPIVLLHPASGSGLIWGYQRSAFAAAGYRVIAYSRRGYYGSAPLDQGHPGTGSEDLHGLAEFLGLGWFHIVASAAGGGIASDYAFSHPERLLSLTISSNQFGLAEGEIPAAGARIRPKIWEEIPVEFREVGPSYRARNPDGFAGWVELHRKSGAANGFPRQSLKNRITEAMLGTLTVPTLVISGVADLSTPPAIARLIVAKIPNAELVVAPESGHSVYWEEPELFNRAVLGFIAKHGK